jgi:hypothetical protein
VKPVPAVWRTNRADVQPYSEDEGKRDFHKYIEELENMMRSGRPEAGEAQIRLAQIRKASRTPSS